MVVVVGSPIGFSVVFENVLQNGYYAAMTCSGCVVVTYRGGPVTRSGLCTVVAGMCPKAVGLVTYTGPGGVLQWLCSTLRRWGW